MRSHPLSAKIHPFHTQSESAPASAPVPFEGGDLILSHLEQLGVEYVFGIPGGAIEPLYNALAITQADRLSADCP